MRFQAIFQLLEFCKHQPEQIALGTTPGTTDKLKLDYTYGTTANNGNLLSQTITVPAVGSNNGFVAVQNYNYDSLNRLKDATENVTPNGGSASQSWKQTFTFDRYGNRNFDQANTTMPASFANPAVTNPTISATNNRITSTGWLYDAAGNTTRDGNYQTFTYDAENKQTEVKNASSVTLGRYWYDGDGKRVKKYVPASGETTVFVYDAAGKQIAEYSTIVANSNDAKVSYLTNDTLGSPRITTDQNGQTISRRDFMPFGEETFTPQRTQTLGYTSDNVRQKFTAYERDNESDLDFAQARYHNSDLGRFSTADIVSGGIINPQSLNKYIYVMNNPLSYIDPSGYCGTTAGSPDKSPCIWLNNGNSYQSVSQKEYDGGNFSGWTVVTDIDSVVLDNPTFSGTYAGVTQYQNYESNRISVQLGSDGMFYGVANDSRLLDDESGGSAGLNTGVSASAGLGFAGVHIEGNYTEMIFATNHGVRDNTFVSGAFVITAFGRNIVAYPKQQGVPIIVGANAGLSFGPVLSTATQPSQIEGTFVGAQGTASVSPIIGVTGGLQGNADASSGNLQWSPGVGVGGYGNLTTNTFDITKAIGPTNPRQFLINSIPRRP